jgi:uncharacterized membrane protein YkoI
MLIRTNKVAVFGLRHRGLSSCGPHLMIIRTVSAVLGLVLGAAQVHAAGTSPVPIWGYLGLAVPNETSSDISLFGDARLSIPQAIDAVQKHVDGRVIEIGFAHRNGEGWYRVLVASSDALHSLRINPGTAAVSRGDQPDITRAELDTEGQRDLDALRSAKISLQQAVAAAEKTSGGKAMSAGVEQLEGIPQYYVQTLVKGRIAAFIVDPQTGLVMIPGG